MRCSPISLILLVATVPLAVLGLWYLSAHPTAASGLGQDPAARGVRSSAEPERVSMMLKTVFA
jgi:hypothetical protein